MQHNKFAGIKSLDELILKSAVSLDSSTFQEVTRELQIIEDTLNVEMHDVDPSSKERLLEAIKRIVELFGSKLSVKERLHGGNQAVPSL